MGTVLGDAVWAGGKFNIRVANNLSDSDRKFVAQHFASHSMNAMICQDIFKDEVNGAFADESSKPVTSEDKAIADAHIDLTNSVCQCGCRQRKTFKKAVLCRQDGNLYKTVVAYSCPDCTAEIQRERAFSKGIMGRLKRLFRR